MKNKILLLSSLVATTYSADSGHSVRPLSYNVIDTSYFAINVGMSHHSDFLSFIDKDKFNAAENKLVNYALVQKNQMKSHLAIVWQTQTASSLNILSSLQAFFDINLILRPSSFMNFSWSIMRLLKQGLYHYNLRAEAANATTGSKKTLFYTAYALPTLTLNIPYIALRIDIAQLLLYSTQLKHIAKQPAALEDKKSMNFYLGVFFSSVRFSPKMFNNYYGDVVSAKVLDLVFASVAAWCLKDFSFQYWRNAPEVGANNLNMQE